MLAWCARTLLRAAGWQVEFDGLPGPHGVIIVYPHTSNWDFVLGLLAKWALGLPIRWIGKETLFRGATGATLGRMLRAWGGRPVDRHHASGAVDQLVALVRSEPWCWLGLSPEGTRRYTNHLRSGFYHLTRALDVPLGLGYFDYRTRTIGLTRFVRLTGEVERDLQTLRDYYADKVARRPAQASRIAFTDAPAPGKKKGA